MLVHDSIVLLSPDEECDSAKEILARSTQRDRGCSILGCPIGIDTDVHQDYSVGKFEKVYELKNGILSRIPVTEG